MVGVSLVQTRPMMAQMLGIMDSCLFGGGKAVAVVVVTEVTNVY